MSADLILRSSGVLTMAGDTPTVVAVTDGRVTEVGSDELVDRLRGPDTELLDVGDRTLLPGFIDVHAHLEVAARTLQTTVDCRAPACATVQDVLEALSDGLGSQVRDGWMVGQGNLFFDQKLRDRRLPTREELDSVSRDVAIALRAGGHITVLNSRALEAAGLGAGYRAPEHSITGMPEVELGADGHPTGVVREFDNALPLPDPDRDELRAALRDGTRRLFTAHGVTTVGEISETTAGLELLDGLIDDGELGLRMAVYLWAPGTMSVEQACTWSEHLTLRAGEDRFRIQGLKLFSDGGYSAASAATKQPYLDGHCGKIALTEEGFAETFHRATGAGLQLAVHANGDGAQEWLCAAIAAEGGAPSGRLRTRIEHAGNFLPDYEATTQTWTRAGIIPVPQPVFIYTFGDFFASYLGDYGTRGRFPFRRLIDDGWELTGSSDVWIGSEDHATEPMFSVWCCLARQSFLGERLHPDQAVTLEEALAMHTVNAARVLGVEDHRGTIEAGKVADLAVLDRDVRRAATDDLRDVAVDLVFSEGRLGHDRVGGGAPPQSARAAR
jgi:predicted amidohydrolase YtcJ